MRSIRLLGILRLGNNCRLSDGNSDSCVLLLDLDRTVNHLHTLNNHLVGLGHSLGHGNGNLARHSDTVDLPHGDRDGNLENALDGDRHGDLHLDGARDLHRDLVRHLHLHGNLHRSVYLHLDGDANLHLYGDVVGLGDANFHADGTADNLLDALLDVLRLDNRVRTLDRDAHLLYLFNNLRHADGLRHRDVNGHINWDIDPVRLRDRDVNKNLVGPGHCDLHLDGHLDGARHVNRDRHVLGHLNRAVRNDRVGSVDVDLNGDLLGHWDRHVHRYSDLHILDNRVGSVDVHLDGDGAVDGNCHRHGAGNVLGNRHRARNLARDGHRNGDLHLHLDGDAVLNRDLLGLRHTDRAVDGDLARHLTR